VRNLLISVVGRIGALPRTLAGNLAQLDLTYRDGWHVGPSTVVDRLVPAGRGEASDATLAFRLLVPSALAARVNVEVVQHASVAVRVVARDDLNEVILVRPDGYIAARTAPTDLTNLLKRLDHALCPSGAALTSALR
jgi:hypothetical protein